MPSPGDLSVVICAYTEERWDDLVEALDSVRRQATPVSEIVLVVDHNDALLARCRQAFGSAVIVVGNAHERGLSGARNTGIEASSKPIVGFLDDDAAAERDWAERLSALYADRRVVAVGGLVRPRWLAARPAWFPDEFNWVVGCSYTGMPEVRGPVRNPIGANMSVRRSAIQTVGGFDVRMGRIDKYPAGCEETEFFIRVQQKIRPAEVLYEPRAIVDHKVPAARGTFDYFRRRCFAEGLSKATVSRLVGSAEALDAERRYTVSTLPRGIWQGVRQGIGGDMAGFARAGVMVVGLVVTAAGYVWGRLFGAQPPSPQSD